MAKQKARVPAALTRDLAELDAEARQFLERQRLPAWLGLYRRIKPKGGENISIIWQRGRTLRGAEPMVSGVLPFRAAIISSADQLDPSARYVMRLWMAKHRQRLAIRRRDRPKRAAAEVLWAYLLRHPPSLDRGARNIAGFNVPRAKTRAAEWARWQAEADAIWADDPTLSKDRVADRVVMRLKLTEHPDTVARHLRWP